ncbi:MAG: nucleoside 2-deoxyribosyltransferase [Ignavibacteriaceae bacterium]|nr:nucleoside 2-deoxyribosyltransferase [Ignavibacteriaceae bacterium]
MQTKLKVKPNIEELVKTIKRGKGSFIPIAELGVHPLIKEKFIGRKITTLEDEIEFWYGAGYDYIKLQPVADFNPAKIGIENNLMLFKDGTSIRKWASEKKGVITNIKEYESYLFPSSSDFNYKNFELVSTILPEGMGVIGQYGDIFTMTWEMMGFEAFSFALYENPELVYELNNKLGELVVSMFEFFAQSDIVNILWYSDDIAYRNGLLASPEVLDGLFFRWLRKIGKLCKEYNKPLIYHSDGILFPIMENIIECGVDALHPIEPKAMSIVEVKERYGDKLSLIGNIEVDLLARGTPEEVKKSVLKNIELVGMNGGYCVGSSNSIPEYINFENYITMIRTVKEFSFGS